MEYCWAANTGLWNTRVHGFLRFTHHHPSSRFLWKVRTKITWSKSSLNGRLQPLKNDFEMNLGHPHIPLESGDVLPPPSGPSNEERCLFVGIFASTPLSQSFLCLIVAMFIYVLFLWQAERCWKASWGSSSTGLTCLKNRFPNSPAANDGGVHGHWLQKNCTWFG